MKHATNFFIHSRFDSIRESIARTGSAFRLVAACVVFLGAIAPIAAGQAPAKPERSAKPPAPDVIVFNNGDQLTGKFLRSIGGNAVFHSDIAGDVTVSWDKVKEIHSASMFYVLQKGFTPGRKELPAHLPQGKLTVENKQIELTPSDGAHTEPISLANVAYVIDQPTFDHELRNEPGFFSGWGGNATAGATLVQATTDNYTASGGISLVRVVPPVAWLSPRNRTAMDFSGSYGKITEPGFPVVKSAIYHADAERDEYFSARTYALAQVAFDHNFAQSLDLQQIYGGGLGRTMIKQPQQTLDLKATVQYESQDFIAATPGANQNLIGSTIAANYMRKLPRNMVFTQLLSYIPAWNDLHAYSVGETNTFLIPAYKRLNLSLGTIDTYLNDPPATTPPTKTNSFQFTMGVTYAFPVPH